MLNSFLWGGVTSLVLASAVGYGLAKAGLAPVEAMRRRAAELSMSGSSEGLPLPPARDELRRLGVTLNAMLGRIREFFEGGAPVRCRRQSRAAYAPRGDAN